MTLEHVNVQGEIHAGAVKDRPAIDRVKPLLTGENAPMMAIASTG